MICISQKQSVDAFAGIILCTHCVHAHVVLVFANSTVLARNPQTLNPDIFLLFISQAFWMTSFQVLIRADSMVVPPLVAPSGSPVVLIPGP